MQNRNIPNEKPSALIISAGNSSRMGIPKFMLRFDANFTFLEKIVDEYLNYGCRQIVVVLNPDGEKTIKNTRSKISGSVIFAINPNPLKERMLSVQIGLQHLQMPQKVFIHPVDNPFVIHSVLDNLLCKPTR